MSRWDDQQYLKFHDQRTRAAAELLARVRLENEPAGTLRIVDLGCGPGNSTALLAARWPQADIVGVDSSAEMLARARRDFPSLRWQQGDLTHWTSESEVDLLFANAVLQWLPDHDQLLPRLFRCLRPGGVFAFQVPCNFDEPSHRAMRTLPGPWASAVAAVRELAPVGSPVAYYDRLVNAGESAGDVDVDIWQTTYQHVMPSPAAIVEWVKGTGLRPYLEAVAEDQRAQYLAAYEAAIDAAYPPRKDGRRLFSFPRLFVVASRRPRS